MPARIKPGDKVRHKKYKRLTGIVLKIEGKRSSGMWEWQSWLAWGDWLVGEFPWTIYRLITIDLQDGKTPFTDSLEWWEIAIHSSDRNSEDEL